MTDTTSHVEVEVRESIAAAPETVYALVSDVTRMGEWSPETSSCQWVGTDRGPRAGARFRGTNKRGPLFWTTTCRVTAAEPGRRFAFTVTWFGQPISDWSYDFIAEDGGCTVVEAWADRRHAGFKVASVPVMGIRDRAAHNRRGMVATLAALKSTAEAND